ncbi:MAG TPA: hypothetical protein VFS03_11840 [Microvirga sp.]|nr:hypothetical protein [Microvirga sp.]
MARFGAFLRNAFGGSRTDPEAVARVKAWVHGILKPGSGTALAVNEIACTDPSCPGVETIVLIMEPGRKTRACKVQKPVDAVTEQDIREALQ